MKRTILSLFVGLFCIAISYSQDYNFNTNLIPELLNIDANAVIRFEDVSIEIKSQREMTVKIEKAVTIYNKFADGFSNLSIHYDKRKTIKNVSAFIYDSSGNKIKKIKSGDFKDYSAYDGISLYNDGRVLNYDYTPISYPYTIHYKYEIKTSNTAFINKWIPIKGYYQSVQNSKFTIKYPSDILLRKSEKNFEGFNIKLNEDSETLSYNVSNISAINYEPNAPLFLNFVPNVKLGVNKFNLEGVDGEANNWKEFGKWYYENLIKNTLDLSETTKEKIRKLTAGISDPIEKAKVVYNFVQNKVRYISVQVGIGGFRPMLAGDVDNLGYGDCKGLTNYTAALLKEVGIDSYHTLIHADDKIDFDEHVASPEGNHMILYVPIANKDIWLECTSQIKSFSEIGDFTDDRDGLIIAPEGGEIKHTRIYKTDENLQFTKGRYLIDSLGTISAIVSIESFGTQYDNHLGKYDGKTKKQLDVSFKRYLSNINNLKFSKIEVYNNKKEAIYKENLEFKAVDYSSVSGNQVLIPINAFNKNLYVPKRVRNRKLPVQILRGFVDVDEVEIKLPRSYELEYMPENVEIKTKFGNYSIEISKIGNDTYNYKRVLKIEGGKYPKDDYNSYRSFRKKIAKYDNSKIILIKK